MMALSCRRNGPRAVRDDSRGQLLVEVLIALAILGLIATVFIGAMYTSLQAARVTDERSTALTLAKSQIEFVKGQQDYSTVNDWDYTVTTEGWSADNPPSWLIDKPFDYVVLSNEYDGYSVTVTGQDDYAEHDWAEEGIRLLTATVEHHGESVLALSNYEVDRY